MQKIIVSTMGLMIFSLSIHADKIPKDTYINKQFEYRNIKAKIVENEELVLLNARLQKLSKMKTYNRKIKISDIFRDAQLKKRAQKSLLRDELAKKVSRM